MVKLTADEKAARARQRDAGRAMASAVRAEEEHGRARESQELWIREGMYLTREETVKGGSCRGCGLPVIDGSGGWTRGTMHMDAGERGAYEVAETNFRLRHTGCSGFRWSIEGSRTTHCGTCCLPIPFSDEQLTKVAAILAARRPDTDLDRWRQILTCGNEAESLVNVFYRTSHRASGVAHCQVCKTERGVVTVELAGPLTAPDLASCRNEQAESAEALKAAQDAVAEASKDLCPC